MKKKEEEAPKGSPAWMATFSDLMNLLMCFFVLLFAMSSVDESKAVAMIKSLNDTFSIFSGGGSGFEEGVLISSGASQLSNLDDYYNETGRTDDGTSVDNVDDNSPGAENDGNDNNDSHFGELGDNDSHTGDNDNNPPTADNPNQGTQGSEADNSAATGMSDEELAELAASKYQQEKEEQTTLMYGEIISVADKFSVLDVIDVAVDKTTYEYVSIEINGAVLFDAGEDKIKADAIPVLSRIGDILKTYKDFKIEVIGHTDNKPTNPDRFANNDILSVSRAISVATFFAEEKRMGWDNLYYAGRGEHEPIASNATADGRAKNRRVEIRLYSVKKDK